MYKAVTKTYTPSLAEIEKILSLSEIATIYKTDALKAFSVINSFVKKDKKNGWKKQEQLLKVLIDNALPTNTEYLYDDLRSFGRAFWDNAAGFFGVHGGTEKERYKKTLIIFNELLEVKNTKKRKTIISELFSSIKKATYLASGANRYAPLAIFVTNLFSDKNIYAPNSLLNYKKFNLLLKNHIFYNQKAQNNDENIKYETSNLYFPELPYVILNKPIINKNHNIYWLDIGCAPKNSGSPALKLLKNTFEQYKPFKKMGMKLNFTGTDIFFPYYSFDFSTKKISANNIFSKLNKRQKLKTYGGITYMNANYHKYDAASTAFMSNEEKKYDFISICKVIHHFSGNEKIIKQHLPKKIKINGKIKGISWIANFPLHYYLSKKQKLVIANLLRLLKIGGYLFLDLSNPYKTLPNNINHNFFFIITRLSNNKFELLDAVIPYDPDSEKVYPHNEYILHNQEFLAKKFNIDFSKNTSSNRIFDDDYAEIRQAVRQLDIFVYYFQSIYNIPNFHLWNANKAIMRDSKLSDACNIYLQGFYETIKKQNPTNKLDILNKVDIVLRKIKEIEHKYRKLSESIVNVMLIGCGGAARDSYLPGIFNTFGANLTGIVIPGDVTSKQNAIYQIEETFKGFKLKNRKKLVAKCTNCLIPLKLKNHVLSYDNDWEQIENILDLKLKKYHITAVIIGSPEGYHHKYIEWALKNHLHIACDKPLTSRVGVATDSLAQNPRTGTENKTALATELIKDYDKYIAKLNELETNFSKKLEFEVLTKKRYSAPILMIRNELQKSSAKVIQIFTADGWWLTPAQLARNDIFTMYGMNANKSDGGKLVHTAAHFLDLAILFAKEGKTSLKNIDVTICFVKGYDCIIRSNRKKWLDIEALGAGIVDEKEKDISSAQFNHTISKLPEINLALQITLSFGNGSSVYIQLMGLHENLAKMANKSTKYHEQFQSRTKVDRIFILQDNGQKIEYKRFGKINTGIKNISKTLNYHELYVGKKKIKMPIEYNLDAKPVIQFLDNVKLHETFGKNIYDKIFSHSPLKDHEYDAKIIALIYKKIAEDYFYNSHAPFATTKRQLHFQHVFDSDCDTSPVNHNSSNFGVPFYTIDKQNNIDKAILDKVNKIRCITKYGIIAIQCTTFGGVARKKTHNSTGFDFCDNLISLVRYSYQNIDDEKLIDWQIKLQKDPKHKIIIIQIVFYGEKQRRKYIACQLQLTGLDIKIETSNKILTSRPLIIQSLNISQSPFALINVSYDEKKRSIKLSDFYSKKLRRCLSAIYRSKPNRPSAKLKNKDEFIDNDFRSYCQTFKTRILN